MGPLVAQGLAALIASLTTLDLGMFYGWATHSLPELLQNKTTSNNVRSLTLTPDEASWVASIGFLSAMLGPIFLTLMVDRIGRKWSLNVVVLPMLISWFVVGIATSVELLYVGRFIGGLSLGANMAVISMYLGEIADNKLRGILGTVMTIAPIMGKLLVYCIGPWMSRAMLSIVSSLPIMIFVVAFFWIPESPYFWLMTGAPEKAKASLIWFRRRSNVDEELRSLESSVKQKNGQGLGIAELFRTTSNRKAFTISLGLMSLQQLSGGQAIDSYAGVIFDSSGLSGWKNIPLIIAGTLKLLAALSVVFLIDHVGRRPILMLSSLFTSLFLTCLGLFFHMKYLGYDTNSLSWIPVFGVAGFYLAITPGLSCIPWIMIGELFPTDVKAPASMMLSIYGAMLAFLVTKMYEPLTIAIGIHWVYYMFAIIILSGIVFIYVCVPETKKLSLHNIQANLISGKSTVVKKTIEKSCKIDCTKG